MIILHISEADRTRIGCPSTAVEFDQNILMLSEAIVMEEKLGISVPTEFLDSLIPKPLLGSDQEPVIGSDGEPRMSVQWQSWRFALWVGLQRIGIDVDLDTLEVNVNAFRFVVPKVAEVKAPDPKGPSTRAKRPAARKRPSAAK
jgi:hypothetical protein